KDYVGDSWNEAWKGSESSLSKGFISDYSSKEPNEDFVELIAHYVTFTPQKWDETLEKAGAEGKEKLQQKIEIVKNYMNTVWKIDLDRLRNEVLSRATNLDNVDLDKIKIK
ncbi:substrate import-associated zinc metallohydrolase lipoprotein, partial [Ornithobacterium rhinotracheale]|uniref:substrate import-associated zinc metallohydrolase lipoprotein n=5 Tax=Ornithobacterium rhinotracheale TaxID=28251 RepID=UPI003873945D